MRADSTHETLRATRRRDTAAAIGAVLELQRAEVLHRVKTGASTLVASAWDGKLRDALFPENQTTAREIGWRVAKDLGDKRANFEPDDMDPWLLADATTSAEAWNQKTAEDLEAELAAAEEQGGEVVAALVVGAVFDLALSSRLDRFSSGVVTSTGNFGGHHAAESNGAISKRWNVNSTNPRSSHTRMRGLLVPMEEKFPNGLRWPGDKKGGADETAGCKCSMTFIL
ncbi:hypothetical protein ACTWPB_07600 [Nocardia sp. IBHARD005]|uniref:hypothetical protein n=1 Tax=Nocardia sp. IBHARD005 TaxID=3457765 RepID=UPI0040598916